MNKFSSAVLFALATIGASGARGEDIASSSHLRARMTEVLGGDITLFDPMDATESDEEISYIYENGTVMEGVFLFDVTDEEAIEISSKMMELIQGGGMVDIDAIYGEVEILNANYTIDFIEDAIEAYPDHFSPVAELYQSIELDADTTNTEALVKGLAVALETEAKVSGSIEKALEDLGMTMDEVDAAFDAYGHQELADGVIAAFEAAKQYKIDGLASALGTNEAFDVVNGTARFLSSSPSFQDQIDEIHEGARVRKLSKSMEKSLTAKTLEFQARLNDHVQMATHHMRKLNDSRMLSDRRLESLRSMETKVNEVNTRVGIALQPLISLLDKLSNAQSTLHDAKMITSTIHITLLAASKIPKVGPVFKAPEQAFKTVNTNVKNADTKLTRFEERVSTTWERTIGRVLVEMASFEEMLPDAADIQDLATDLSESQCFENIVEGIVGLDFVQEALSAAQVIETYSTQLVSVLEGLETALDNQVWRTTSGVLNVLVDVLNGPIAAFTKPFEPLTALMQQEITIPFVSIPYAKKNVGPAKCKSRSAVGYYSQLGEFKHTCWESDSTYWKTVPLAIPPKLKVTCSRGGMTTDMWGKCNGKRFGRSEKSLTCTKKCSKKYGSQWYRSGCGKCKKKCCGSSCYGSSYWDYTTETSSYCYKRSCGTDFTTYSSGKSCGRNTKNKRKHSAVCSSYSECQNGGICKVPSTGGCFTQCKSGDQEFTGLCFGRPSLTISVQGIFDAFSAVLDFISDLPIVHQILLAIETLVKPILAPVTNAIENWLANLGITIPDIGDLGANLLPFAAIDDVLDINLPVPTFDDLFGLPADIMSRLNAKLPDFPDCGGDIDCYLQGTPYADMKAVASDLHDTVSDVFFVGEDLYHLKSTLQGLMDNIECTEWTTKAVSADDMLKSVGFTDLNLDSLCPMEMPICAKIQASQELQEATDSLVPILLPIVSRIQEEITSGRRLNEWYGTTIPVLTLASAGLSYKANGSTAAPSKTFGLVENGLPSPFKTADDPPVTYVGTSLSMGLSASLSVSIKVPDQSIGETFSGSHIKFGVSFGGDVSISSNFGLEDILEQAVTLVDEQFDVNTADTIFDIAWGACTEPDPNGKWIVKSSILDKYRPACNKVDFPRLLADYNSGGECTTEKMITALDDGTLTKAVESKKAGKYIECAKYLHNMHKELTGVKKSALIKDLMDTKTKWSPETNPLKYIKINTDYLTRYMYTAGETESSVSNTVSLQMSIAKGVTVGPVFKWSGNGVFKGWNLGAPSVLDVYNAIQSSGWYSPGNPEKSLVLKWGLSSYVPLN